MSLGELVRNKRKELDLTQDQLAVKVGISKPYLSHIETGKVKNPPSDTVLRGLERSLSFARNELVHLAHLARTPPDIRDDHELMQAQVQKLRKVLIELMKHPKNSAGQMDVEGLLPDLTTADVARVSTPPVIPIINTVSMGYPRSLQDLDHLPGAGDEYVRCPDIHDPRAFAIRVVGDSMEPMYSEGDIVVFSPNTPASEGDDCFVRRADDEPAAFRRYYRDNQSMIRLQPLNNTYPSSVCEPREIASLSSAVYRIQRIRSKNR